MRDPDHAEPDARRDPSAPDDRRGAPRTDPARTAHHDAIYTLARASELHDPDTGDHVLRIRRVVECIALRLGFDPLDAESLGYDAMLHDVGKLMVDPEILRHPDGLDDEQRRAMQAHTIFGEQLLADRPSLARAAAIARSHHERYDGGGYPDGLRGAAIPLAARITAAADVFDALVSRRPYKRAWSRAHALEEIARLSGTALHPEVVDALQACARAGDLERDASGEADA